MAATRAGADGRSRRPAARSDVGVPLAVLASGSIAAASAGPSADRILRQDRTAASGRRRRSPRPGSNAGSTRSAHLARIHCAARPCSSARPRLLERQPVTHQFAQQRVVAEPFVLLAERDHEGVGTDEFLQDRWLSRPTGEVIGEVTVELLGDAGPQQEVPVLARQPLDHLADQVVGDGSVVPGEAGDASVDIRRIEGHGGQPEARRPALGAGPQDVELFRAAGACPAGRTAPPSPAR